LSVNISISLLSINETRHFNGALLKTNSHSSYALEKLSSAVYYLAIGGGNIRSRLKTAYLEFHPVSVDDFPLHLQSDWKWIIAQLTRLGPVRDEDGVIRFGAIDHTLSKIRNSTGSEIAQRIVSLQSELEVYLQNEP
jgi:hypothetical protein